MKKKKVFQHKKKNNKNYSKHVIMDSKLSIVHWFYTIHNCKVSLPSFLNRDKGPEIRNAKKKITLNIIRNS